MGSNPFAQQDHAAAIGEGGESGYGPGAVHERAGDDVGYARTPIGPGVGDAGQAVVGGVGASASTARCIGRRGRLGAT